jgi:Zn-finger nucleic acid-binding protein
MHGSIYKCPTCAVELSQRRHSAGSSWVCPGCEGLAIGITIIRQHANVKVANALWNRARESGQLSERCCPSCGERFKALSLEGDGRPVELDACLRCQFIWFDHTELEATGILLKSPASSEARKAAAELDVDLQAQQAALKPPELSLTDLVLRYLFEHL